ncbi:MAG: helix-turn-helix transcriptional regulator [Bacillota bacterium]
MIDIHQLPDAWETVYRIGGEEGSKCDELYDIYYKISTAIFKYRVKHDLSQKKLAQKLGVTQSMVSKLESGDYNYTIEQLWKVSQKLGFKFNVVFEEEDEDYSVASAEETNQESIGNHSSMAVG